MILRITLSLLLIQISASAVAQTANPDRNKPLEITADESMEWHRNDFYFKANKNVKAIQGTTTLLSEVLIAKYRDGKDGGMKIHTIQAAGSVQIISADSKAYGDKAIYEVDKGYTIMTGDNLRLTSDDQNVTARDKFEYWVNKGKLVATGKAKAQRLGDTLEADKIIATFKETKQGKRELQTLEAIGNVVITTPDEVLTGNKAIYNSSTNIAELHDNVKIKRGPNIVEGKKAQVNLATNVSKIFGSTQQNGRVRGVFYPGSKDISGQTQ